MKSKGFKQKRRGKWRTWP